MNVDKVNFGVISGDMVDDLFSYLGFDVIESNEDNIRGFVIVVFEGFVDGVEFVVE